jgi:NAD-dependent deacetylase
MMIPERLIEKLAAAKHIAVLTGAGVSAESGVPTFRDAQTGLWADFKPEDLATPEAFRRNPRRVWEWYAWRREAVTTVAPNPAHHALAAMQKLVPRFTLITQNVDGLHQRAGSLDVIELHGNIARTKCFDEDTLVTTWPDHGVVPPQCPRCGGHLRPDVVWFGENLPEKAMLDAAEASATCDIFFSIGTSAEVYPAAVLPLKALKVGATVIEINPAPTPLTRHVHFALSGAAGVILPELLAGMMKPPPSSAM